MERFYTIIKLKETQLLEIQKKIQLKDLEIKDLKDKMGKVESEIHELKNIRNQSVYPETYLIIDNLKSKWLKMEVEIQDKLSDKRELFSELMIKKQEIKSIELLIEKKTQELKFSILKKEQENLDELNSI